jgi:hypothetical protein|tara:strand:+ start:8692 stop:8904 length:213 start_codon:yes stop_codon:yes gene_type:complete
MGDFSISSQDEDSHPQNLKRSLLAICGDTGDYPPKNGLTHPHMANLYAKRNGAMEKLDELIATEEEKYGR